GELRRSIVTGGVAALDGVVTSGFDENVAAFRADIAGRLVPTGEIAFRIAAAAVEDALASFARAFLDHLALVALRTLYADLDQQWPSVAALRKAGAGEEAADLAELDHHRPPA